jgi:glycosyltransferase involved in cell wall biosynthesis
MPKISIIIPCYNSEQFIDRTIKSVLCQTFSDWELLLIDDHSTDKTKDILEKYAKNDTRIKILQTKENSGGPALPKNIGIENAKGEYIAFLDHDDEWLPEKLEKQLAVFENSKDEKLGLVSCYFYIVDKNFLFVSWSIFTPICAAWARGPTRRSSSGKYKYKIISCCFWKIYGFIVSIMLAMVMCDGAEVEENLLPTKLSSAGRDLSQLLLILLR